jgi:deoxyhypusine synthase
MTDAGSQYLRGPRIEPRPITGRETVAELMDGAFLAYNAGRLREAGRLFTERMLANDGTVGLSITGALTPAGLGMSTVIPLIEAGFVDWIVSTGANLYHDAHFGLGFSMHAGRPNVNDVILREEGVVRIYDIFFDYRVLLRTDAFIREVSARPEFQRMMSSAEYHYLLGGYLRERERALGLRRKSLLAVAHEHEVPIYTSSPGDSSIGMNVAELALAGYQLRYDVSADVNETSAIVLDAKRSGGTSSVLIVGGGSPKNFVLQTEPQIQEVLGIDEKGHDYYLQITDARPDTGGLSGATPAEAVSWGKVDPSRLPDAVVAYVDSTIGLPLLTAYALARVAPRAPKRLYARRGDLMNRLRAAYQEAQAHRDERARASRLPGEV